MGIVIGVIFIVLGIVSMTPAGARLSMRMNDAPGSGGQGYKPKSVTATRVLGAVVFVVGIVVVATQI